MLSRLGVTEACVGSALELASWVVHESGADVRVHRRHAGLLLGPRRRLGAARLLMGVIGDVPVEAGGALYGLGVQVRRGSGGGVCDVEVVGG